MKGRVEKNKRLSKILAAIGFTDTAIKITSDPQINEAEEFNVYKTWTEYINRLIGAIVGFSLLFILISSIFLLSFSFFFYFFYMLREAFYQ